MIGQVSCVLLNFREQGCTFPGIVRPFQKKQSGILYKVGHPSFKMRVPGFVPDDHTARFRMDLNAGNVRHGTQLGCDLWKLAAISGVEAQPNAAAGPVSDAAAREVSPPTRGLLGSMVSCCVDHSLYASTGTTTCDSVRLTGVALTGVAAVGCESFSIALERTSAIISLTCSPASAAHSRVLRVAA